jgi:predicted translin family RNA/ssDNA-binding protein
VSNPAKNSVLRAILSDDASIKMATALGTPGRTDSNKIPLTSEQLTTEQIVGRIKELSKLREEILQVMRQLNLTREAAPSSVDQIDYNAELESVRQELERTRNMYQEVQGRIEKIQRHIDGSKKRIAALTEISQTGFATDQLESEAGDFLRVLGRLPVRKLEAAQKAIRSQFKDQAIIAVGNKKQDAVYILLATPKDKTSQALQNLIQYDFSSIEIPQYKSRDLGPEVQEEEDTLKALSKELDELKLQLDDLREKANAMLNRRLDEVVDSLMVLRAILKLGEGTQASRIYARLEKVPSPEMVTNLSKRGVIELETSS